MKGYMSKDAVIDLITKGHCNLSEAQKKALEELIVNAGEASVIPVSYIDEYQGKMRRLLKGRYFADEVIGWLIKDWRIDSDRYREKR